MSANPQKDQITLGSSQDSTAPEVHQNQRIRHLERLVSSAGFPGLANLNFSEDSQNNQPMHQQAFPGRGWGLGVITHTIPSSQCYYVSLGVGRPELVCHVLTSLAPSLGGIRENVQLPCGTVVLVYKPAESLKGIILGCLPLTGDGSTPFADWICQGSSVGTLKEAYYSTIPERFEDGGGIVDFAVHSPADSLSVGEWCLMNDLGGGFFADPLMSFVRVDESSGLWLFHMDRLTRLSGYNYDFRSCASEEIIRNDEGEVFHYKGWAPYTWEALGHAKAGSEISDGKENEKEVVGKEIRAKIEPKKFEQLPIYRLEEFRGYAGQGYMRQLSLPDLSDDEPNTITKQNSQTPSGVFREQLGLDGSWSTLSSHSIHLVKRGRIPNAKLLRQPEDPEGDDLALNTSGYKPAGYYGEDSNDNGHKVKDSIPGERTNSQWSAAALMDELAYVTNWKGYHPFHYHLKDFANYKGGPGAQTVIPEFNKLQDQQWLSLPDTQEVDIDHRYKALLYQLAASLSLNNDGSISLRGGQGCELRFAGGQITISAPGDILIQSGRNTINYAGDDAIIKANNSIDLSSSNNDVRVKAEKNLELMGGNGSTGRVLIEGKGTGGALNLDVIGKQGEDLDEGGVIIKSAGDLVVHSDEHQYHRTRYGTIVLDAAAGQQMIRTNSHSVINQVSGGGQFQINVGIGESPVVHTLSVGRAQFGTSLIVNGPIWGQNGASIRGSVGAVGGTIGQTKTGDPGFELANSLHTQRDQEFDKTSQQAIRDYIENFQEVWYDEKAIGDSTIISNVSFAPRNEAQMGTQDFKLVETYWQQIDVGAGNWYEPTISYQGQEMAPHPGKDRWVSDKAFMKYSNQLIKDGVEYPPGDEYMNLEAGSFKEATIQSEYTIYPRAN